MRAYGQKRREPFFLSALNPHPRPLPKGEGVFQPPVTIRTCDGRAGFMKGREGIAVSNLTIIRGEQIPVLTNLRLRRLQIMVAN